MPKFRGLDKKKLLARQSTATRSEPLEPRMMLSVSLNSSGATVITPNAGDRVIYVSSSTGNDANAGLSPQTAVKTFYRAETLMRNHTGDEMLLKSGDVWHDQFVYWPYSGASAADPMVISSYGSGPRPEVMSGTNSGFATGRSSAGAINYLAIMNINFVASGRDPQLTSSPNTTVTPTGISIVSKSTDILVENCEVQYYAVNMSFYALEGPVSDITVRRNIIVDSYNLHGHSQGLYALGVDGLTLDGNFFDHNGYSSLVPGAVQTVFNHDCYLSAENSNIVVEDNTFARASSYGLVDRPGRIVKDNLFIDDPTDIAFGISTGADTTAGGVSGAVTGNVFMGGANIGSSLAGQGLIIGNTKPGANVVVSGNVFSQSIPNKVPAIQLGYGGGQLNSDASVGINDLTINQNVIYSWNAGFDIEDGFTPGGKGLTALNHLVISNNQFENLTRAPINNHNNYSSQEQLINNSYFNTPASIAFTKNIAPVGKVLSSPFSYPDPTRTLATYDAAIKDGGTIDSFLTHAAEQTNVTLNSIYDASSVVRYIDAGFGIGSSTTPPVVTPPVVTPPVTTPPVTTPPVTTPPATTTRSATTTFQALQYTAQSGGMKFDNHKGLGFISNGNWAEYDGVDFGTGVGKFSATIASVKSSVVGSVQVRLDSITGPIVGKLTVTPTGGWGTYTTQSTTVSGATGVHKLFLVFVGGGFNVDTFAFSTASTPPATTPPAVTTRSAKTTFQALQYNAQSGGMKFDNHKGLGFISNGNWAEYDQVDFGTGVSKFSAAIASVKSATVGTIQLRLDSITGPIVGKLTVTPTGGWGTYTTQSTTVSGAKGVHKLFLVFVGGGLNVDTFTFS